MSGGLGANVPPPQALYEFGSKSVFRNCFTPIGNGNDNIMKIQGIVKRRVEHIQMETQMCKHIGTSITCRVTTLKMEVREWETHNHEEDGHQNEHRCQTELSKKTGVPLSQNGRAKHQTIRRLRQQKCSPKTGVPLPTVGEPSTFTHPCPRSAPY